jgi:hypothetical protein
MTTPSEAQQILSLIDWNFADACMAGYASKRLEELRRNKSCARNKKPRRPIGDRCQRKIDRLAPP